MTSRANGIAGRPRKRRLQRRKMLERRVPIVIAVIVLLVLGVGLAHNYLVDRPRVAAEVTAKLESRDGEVLLIDHAPQRPREPAYVIVVFDGQESRCSLDLLMQNPPVFQCDPAVNVK